MRRIHSSIVCETSIGSLSASVRDLQFKSIIYPTRTRLYDIKNDPLEMKDLADDPKYSAVKQRHRENFRQYISQIEIYPGPSGRTRANVPPRGRRGDPYKAYVNWYERVKAESQSNASN